MSTKKKKCFLNVNWNDFLKKINTYNVGTKLKQDIWWR